MSTPAPAETTARARPWSRVVTVSATYGTGGSVIGPQLAERLGFTFLDRLVAPVDSGMPASTEEISEHERAATPMSRWLWALARIPAVVATAPMPAAVGVDPETEMREGSERAVREALAAGDTVVLGRAGAVVLARHPMAFHLRLDGPVERRVARAMAVDGVAADVARRRLTETDRLRALFVRRLYGRDPADADLYHITIDATVLRGDDVVEVAAVAAQAFWAAASAT